MLLTLNLVDSSREVRRGMDETELALLIQQYFREKGWSEAQHAYVNVYVYRDFNGDSIEVSSGCCLAVDYLGFLVHQGEWDYALSYFRRFSSSAGLQSSPTTLKILFELCKHKLFFCLHK